MSYAKPKKWEAEELAEFHAGFHEKTDNALAEELRLKHVAISQNFGLVGEIDYCVGCITVHGVLDVEWPCDVIKALDVFENQLISCDTESSQNLQDKQDQTCKPLIQPELIKGSECDHTYWGSVPHLTNNYEVVEFAYCPKCGKKL
jgi:hypothetical protein